MFVAIKRLSLTLAWLITFAHGVVPHTHHGHADQSVCAANHSHTGSLLEALSNLFHFSAGEDHLEEFNTPGSQNVFTLPQNPPLLFAGTRDVDYPLSIAVSPIIKAPPLIFGLRAPPVCS